MLGEVIFQLGIVYKRAGVGGESVTYLFLNFSLGNSDKHLPTLKITELKNLPNSQSQPSQ